KSIDPARRFLSAFRWKTGRRKSLGSIGAIGALVRGREKIRPVFQRHLSRTANAQSAHGAWCAHHPRENAVDRQRNLGVDQRKSIHAVLHWTTRIRHEAAVSSLDDDAF